MKKICLIAFSLFMADSFLAAASIDLYGAASGKADLNKESASLEDATLGVKVAVPCVDGRFYWTGEDFSYGLAFNSERLNKTFPVQAKWGKLSVGGGLSRLNNPLLSTSISPFSSAVSTINPVTASLSSSFNKGDTLFFQAGYKNPGTRKSSQKNQLGKNASEKHDISLQNVNLNCYYDPNGKLFSPFGNVAASSLVAFNLPRKLKLSAECTFGSFSYKGLSSSSWYSDSPFYRDGRQNSAVAQVLFSGSGFSSVLTGGFYASPFGDLKTIWKTENKIKIAKSTIGLSALYNPSHNLITPSGKTLDECVQGKVGFQHQVRCGKKFPLFWKFGLGGFYQWNLTEKDDDFRVSCGLQFLCFITSASIVAQSDFNSLFAKGTVTLKNQWYFPAIQPGLKFSASFSPVSDYSCWKTTENCVLYLSFCNNPAVSLQCGAAFAQKDGENAGRSFELSGNVKFVWKKVRCTGKVAFKIDG